MGMEINNNQQWEKPVVTTSQNTEVDTKQSTDRKTGAVTTTKTTTVTTTTTTTTSQGSSSTQDVQTTVETTTTPGSVFDKDDKKDVKNVNDDSLYNDDTNKSIHDAYESVKNSSLFAGEHVECYQGRMENAIASMQNNEKWRVSMDADGDGQMDSMKLLDAVAASYDSELDLYIAEKVQDVIDKYGSCSKQYLSDAALEELASYGIVVSSVGTVDENGKEDFTNRVYSFSLYDPDSVSYDKNTHEYKIDGEMLTDANGKKGSIIFGDCLIPDGYAQGAEVNLASILDQMGYDCVTKADFIGREGEYEATIAQIGQNINNDYYNANGGSLEDLYGATKNIRQSVTNLWGGDGSAPGAYSGSGSDGAAAAAAAEGANAGKMPGILSQEAFNEKVEEYMEDGYTLDKAVEFVNKEYNVDKDYNGDNAKTSETGDNEVVITAKKTKAPRAAAIV